MPPKKVLFVCLGNICRSPMAEGIFRHFYRDWEHSPHFDSAGVAASHSGEDPDKRAIQCLNAKGIDISGLRARQVVERDFFEYDIILAMDASNYRVLKKIAPVGASHVHLILPYAGINQEEVSDPWFGDEAGFEVTYNVLREAAEKCATLWFGKE